MGPVCHEHFVALRTRDWDEVEAEIESCVACEVARQAARDHTQRTKTIRSDVPYGQHIVVVCVTCGASYSTKNICPIGVRSIFGADCGHPVSDLVVA